jgi:hypothetical protein
VRAAAVAVVNVAKVKSPKRRLALAMICSPLMNWNISSTVRGDVYQGER